MSLLSRLTGGTLVAALATCLYLPSAYGAVIYDESVSGDLNGNQATPLNVGALSLGTNTIRGFNSRPTNVGPQGDGFYVSINPLYTITAITLTTTNYSGLELYAATIFRPAPFLGFQQFASLTGNVVRNYTVPTLTTNELGFSIQFQNAVDGVTSFNWEWTVEVEQAQTGVPEASSVSLIAAGLTALTLLGRRRIGRRS